MRRHAVNDKGLKALDATGTIHLPLVVPNASHDDLQLSAVVIGLDAARTPAMGLDLIKDLVPF